MALSTAMTPDIVKSATRAPAVLFGLARLYAVAGGVARADLSLSQGDRDRLATHAVDRAIALLSQAVSGGFVRGPAHRSDLLADFEPVRSQSGFAFRLMSLELP